MNYATLKKHVLQSACNCIALVAAFSAVPVPGLAQSLQVSPTAVVMSAQVAQFGGGAVSQALTITGASGPTNFFVIANPAVPWLRLSQASGTTPSTSTVTLDPANLNQGTYSTTLTIFSGSNNISVPVTFYVSSIGASPQVVNFTYQTDTNAPSAQSIALTGPSGTFNATASTLNGGSWLQALPASGTTPGTINAVLNPTVLAGLPSGTYFGSISVTPTSSASIPPAYIPVTLVVTAQPQISVSASSVAFGYQVGGTNNITARTVQISSASEQSTPFSFTTQVDPNPAGKNWIVVTPSSGSIPGNGSATVSIGFDPTGLPSGIYTGKVSLFTPAGVPTNQDLPVRLVVSNNVLLNVPAASLSFSYQIGGDTPQAQSVTPTATSGVLAYSVTTSTANGVAWLLPSSAGATGSPLAVSVNPAGLAPGTYTGTITVNGSPTTAGSAQIGVTLKVSNDPLVTASVSALSFPYQIGQSFPTAQSVKVSSSTGAALAYTVTASPSWLVTTGASSGTTDGLFLVQTNPAGQPTGTYDGSLTITASSPVSGKAVVNSPLRVPVKMYVSNNPLLVTAQSAPQPFLYQIGGPTPSAQNILLTSTNPAQQMNYSVGFRTDTGGNWLFAGPIVGTTPGTLTITVLPVLLSQGTYTGAVTIAATDSTGGLAANTPLSIPITLQVTTGSISASIASMSFSQASGGTPPNAQTLSVVSSGQPLSFVTVASTSTGGNWLSVTPSSGTTTGALSVSVDGSKLSVGTYQGAILVSSPGAGGSPLRVPVSLTVNAAAVAVTPASLTLTQAVGSTTGTSASLTVSGSPSAVSFAVTTSGASSGGVTWLAATPATGVTPGTVQVTATAGALPIGSYQGTVSVSGLGSGSPINVLVTLNVVASQPVTVAPASLTFSHVLGATAPAAQAVQVSALAGVSFTAEARVQAPGGTWLQVTNASGTTPGSVSASVNPLGLAAGTYPGSITVTSPNATTPVTIPVTLNVSGAVTPVILGLSNAASFASGAIAPGEAITLAGTGIGPSAMTTSQLDATGNVDTQVNQTRVLFDGIPAPILYVSATQTSVLVPYNVSGRFSTQIQVEYKGVLSSAVNQRVADTAPGIFTANSSGTGAGVILNQNAVSNSSDNRAAKGAPISIYATGEGQTSPAGSNGVVTPLNGSGLRTPIAPVSVTIGGVPCQVLYAGSAPGIVSGIMQVTVLIPPTAPSGPAVPIVITVGSASSQPNVTLAIQ
jgi:uncharacterized protein (TIGR03437 family)